MKFERLKLPERPPMVSSNYLAAVQLAADQLRAAQSWLLVQYPGETDWLVAVRRNWFTRLVVFCVNLWRRPRRWWLGRLALAREARSYQRRARGLQ